MDIIAVKIYFFQPKNKPAKGSKNLKNSIKKGIMSENKKWNCKECDSCCQIITCWYPNEFLNGCKYGAKWVPEKPVEKVSSPKKYKLVIPGQISTKDTKLMQKALTLMNIKEVKEGQHFTNYGLCFSECNIPRNWLVEIKDEPMTVEEIIDKIECESQCEKGWHDSDVQKSVIISAKNEALKYKPLVDAVAKYINNDDIQFHESGIQEELEKLN